MDEPLSFRIVPAAPSRPRPALGALLYGLVILAIALAFQGSRGLFEADEGRYVDVALGMLHSGDWWIPRLQGLIYLDKPPVIYWSVAAGIKVLGATEWGARLGQAMALAATALLVGVWAGRAWGARLGRLCGAAYATTLLPVVAASSLTPDTLLTFWMTAVSFSYWQHRGARGPGARWAWALSLGGCAGLGLLTKGTAALVPLAAIAVHLAWEKRLWRFARRGEIWVAALLAVAIGLFWYVAISQRLPGATAYFFDNQVAGRLWNHNYQRNPQWWAPLSVYGAALVLGSLPWSLTWLGLWRSQERRRRLRALWNDGLARYLMLAMGLPVVVFSLASSRLPLYILPVFPCLVMLTLSFAASRRSRPSWGGRVLLAIVAVVALKGLGSVVRVDEDSRALAAMMHRAGVQGAECVVALGIKAHGLSFYGYPRASWRTIMPEPYPYFEAPPMLANDLPRLLETCDNRLRLLVRPRQRATAQGLFAALQLECIDQPLSPGARLFSCRSPGPDPHLQARKEVPRPLVM